MGGVGVVGLKRCLVRPDGVWYVWGEGLGWLWVVIISGGVVGAPPLWPGAFAPLAGVCAPGGGVVD